MSPRPFNPARRALLTRSAQWAGSVTITGVVGRSAPAAAKAAKGDFMYQDHGHDGKRCGECRFYSADGPSAAVGSCAIVAGTISRDGWCAAYAPKMTV